MASATGSVEKNPAAELAAIRATGHAVWLVVIFHDSFSALRALPSTLLRPPGVMQYLSWRFYDRLLTVEGMELFKLALLISLFMGMTGWWTRLTVKTSALLVLLYEGLLSALGGSSPSDMCAVTVLLLLAFLPCGDRFSIDALTGPPVARPRSAYRYPVALIRVLVAWTYVSNGLLVLRFSGRRFLDADNLPAQFVAASLGNLNGTSFRAAFWLIPYRRFAGLVLAIVLLWAILFPLGYFWKKSRPWFLAMGFAVHIGALLFLNKILFTSAAMLLVFFDWVAIAARVRALPVISRAMDWWENYSAAPEFFPGVALPAPPKDGGLLLWDGDCGFCRRMVEWLRAFSLRPVAMRPYQEIPQLPAEMLPWVNRQMHWVRADGSICGGSQALIETLEAGYHNLIAGTLESPPVRPFTWLAYRLVAGHRGVAGKLVGAACELPK